ncbi:hypothetical protein BTVI_84196 [Pitangus sulphuratus]|nr:hypothetical protein BTVI_84196 [Pitangus sulphuratus]
MMCEEIDNVPLWSGKGRNVAKITITEQSCSVVVSGLLFDPRIFKKRIIPFIMDFSDLQFILERLFNHLNIHELSKALMLKWSSITSMPIVQLVAQLVSQHSADGSEEKPRQQRFVLFLLMN